MFRYRTILTSLIIACAFCANTSAGTGKAHAATNLCPRHEIQTSIRGRLAKTKVFRGTSYGFSQYTQGHARGNSQTIGFVQYRDLTTTFDTKFETVDIGNGRYCAKMTKARGYFNVRPKLFMPLEYKKTSCEYQEVLKHERRHITELRNFHKKYKKRFEAHLGRVAKTVPVLEPVSTQEELEKNKKILINHFVDEFKSFENKAWNLLLQAQQKIDTPQEYRGVAKRCSNW